MKFIKNDIQVELSNCSQFEKNVSKGTYGLNRIMTYLS